MPIQPPLPYKTGSGTESAGPYGILGVRIDIHHSKFEYDSRNPAHAKLYDALYDAQERIEQEMMAIAIAADPTSAERTAAEYESLVGSFPPTARIYAEAIPNQYCSRACCRHLPWYKVTGPFGVIILGWRKRVAVVDWSESAFKPRADILFPNEDTTKGEHSIHAWSTDKIRGYLATLFHAFDPVAFPTPPTAVPSTFARISGSTPGI